MSQVLEVLATPMVGPDLSQQTEKDPSMASEDMNASQAQMDTLNHQFSLPDQLHQSTSSPSSPIASNAEDAENSHLRDQIVFEQTQRAVGNLLDALRTNKEQSLPVQDDAVNRPSAGTSENALNDLETRRSSISLLGPTSPNITDPNSADVTFASAQNPVDPTGLLSLDQPAVPLSGMPKSLDHDPSSTIHTQPQDLSNAGILDQPVAETVEEEELPPNVQTAQDTGQISAFAKLEFDDGPFYITTYSLELGRDARAYRAAKVRLAAQQSLPSGEASGSGHSRPSSLSNREGGGSQVKGSVVSERGGFYGVDDIEGEAQEAREERQVQKNVSQASNHSASSIVNPKDLYTQPPLSHFNYQAYPIEEYEREIEEIPAPVTLDHFPEQEEGFLLPIHHAPVKDDLEQDVANHRSVSRRHAKISWEDDCFKFYVKGVNGAFVNEVHHPKGAIVPLREDVSIQIKGIKFQFKLPVHRSVESSEDSDQIEGESPNQIAESSSATSGVERTASPIVHIRKPLKVKLKNFSKASSPPPQPLLGADGKPKRRGPGRPPKDGVMSKRERTAKEKADREAAAKAANGGLTPEPSQRGRTGRPAVKQVTDLEELRPTKRKYTKRKSANHDLDDVTPKLEEDSDGGVDDAPPTKRARVNRSESPEYPKLEDLSEQELQRPPYNYSILIYDLLKDSSKPLDLKGIYRGLKMKWPHFLYRYKDAKGWESSVRHNVNEDKLKIIEKVDRVGKGYSYRAKAGVDIEQHKKKRARSPPSTQKMSAPAQQRYQQQQHPPHPGPYTYPPGHQQPPPHHGMYGHLVPTTVPLGGMSYAASYPPPATANPYSSGPMQPGPHGGVSGPPPHPVPPINQATAGIPHSAGAPIPPASNQTQSGLSNNQPPAPPQHPNSRSYATEHPHRPSTVAGHPTEPHLQRPQQASPHRPPPGVSQLSPFLAAGHSVISTFESSLLDGVENPSDLPRVRATLASVRRRVFEGESESSLPGGETQDERTFLHYFRHILENERFRNPGFLGWEAVERERERLRVLQQTRAAASATGVPPDEAKVQNKIYEREEGVAGPGSDGAEGRSQSEKHDNGNPQTTDQADCSDRNTIHDDDEQREEKGHEDADDHTSP